MAVERVEVAVERVEVVLKMLLVKQETNQERVEEIIHLGKSELNPCNTQA